MIEQVEGLFREAQQEYLKGHWIEAELLIRRLLKLAPAHVEARLLLASIERRSQRLDEAKGSMLDLRRIAGEKWQLEIEMDLRQIEEVEKECGVRNSEYGVQAA